MPGDKSVKECVSLGKHGLKSRYKQCQNKVFDKDILQNGLTYKPFMPTVRLYPPISTHTYNRRFLHHTPPTVPRRYCKNYW